MPCQGYADARYTPRVPTGLLGSSGGPACLRKPADRGSVGGRRKHQSSQPGLPVRKALVGTVWNGCPEMAHMGERRFIFTVLRSDSNGNFLGPRSGELPWIPGNGESSPRTPSISPVFLQAWTNLAKTHHEWSKPAVPARRVHLRRQRSSHVLRRGGRAGSAQSPWLARQSSISLPSWPPGRRGRCSSALL